MESNDAIMLVVFTVYPRTDCIYQADLNVIDSRSHMAVRNIASATAVLWQRVQNSHNCLVFDHFTYFILRCTCGRCES